MAKSTKIAIFEGKKIRRYWDEENEKWNFSVIDVVEVFTGSTIPRRYWSDLKIKLQKEGSEVYEKIVQLKMQAADGKFYLTDAADTESMLRIIQSIPSPNAEPFKLWLARVGYDVPLSFPCKWESGDYLYRFPIGVGNDELKWEPSTLYA